MSKALTELKDGFYVWGGAGLVRVPEWLYKFARMCGATVARVWSREFDSEQELVEFAIDQEVELASGELDEMVSDLEAWEFQERTRRDKGVGE